jgi:hypothetical protein
LIRCYVCGGESRLMKAFGDVNLLLQDLRHTRINTLGAAARRCRRTMAVLATLAVVAGAVGMLDAEPSGASVIAVGGALVFVSPPPPLISPTSIPSDGSIVAFTERTAYTLPTSLPVDITPSTFPTTYTGLGPLSPNTLAAGTPVDSYFMVAPVSRFLYDATVTFSTPILGLIIETSTLRATNSIVGAPGTTYEDFPSQGLKGDDYVELVGPSTIHMDLRSSEFVDEVRVITAASPSTSPGGYGQGGSTGYTEVASDGGIFNFETQFDGSMGGRSLNQPMVGGAQVTGQPGYWTVAKDGGIFSFGSAGFYGSMGGQRLNAPIVGMASTPDGLGYWLVASDGGIFSFGDAGFFGSLGSRHLNAPIVGMASSPDGHGYWLVGSDGGVFSFGDAGFFGSAGSMTLNKPVVAVAPTPDGGGYWLLASDGGIFSYGDAPFEGSMGGRPLNEPMVGIKATADGLGYWSFASDGGVFSFGDAPFLGSVGGRPLNKPVVGGF